MSKLIIKFTQPRSPGYTLDLQAGLLKSVGKKLRSRFKGASPFIISSPRIWKYWGQTLKQGLAAGGYKKTAHHLVPDGEANKNFYQFERALKALAGFSKASEATPFIVLLGGGVIGDLGGFVASCYKRGLSFVQIPTTLLAMVDSSVGGKLGVDFKTPQGLIKNLVGSFYQPQMVLVDPLVLKTLESRQFLSGLGEVIKTAALFDPVLFASLEKNYRGLLSMETALLTRVIKACVAHKARVVSKDEFDRKGLRTLLNLGHTFGHAVEAASGFKLYHGEGVAFGMACAVDLSVRMGVAGAAHVTDLGRIESLCKALGLKTQLKGISLKSAMKAMSQDKKFDGGMKFVLPSRLGKSSLIAVADSSIPAAILKARLG